MTDVLPEKENDILVENINCTNTIPLEKSVTNEMDISMEDSSQSNNVLSEKKIVLSTNNIKEGSTNRDNIEPPQKFADDRDENAKPSSSNIRPPKPTGKARLAKGGPVRVNTKPPRNNGAIKKYSKVQSSGYGQPRSKSRSSASYKSDSEDDCSSIGSTRSVRSLSYNQRSRSRMTASSSSQPQRLCNSTPSSPVNSKRQKSDRNGLRARSNSSSRLEPSPSIRLSESKLKAASIDYTSDAESSWAKEQRQKKNERLMRSGLKVGDTITIETNKINTKPKILTQKSLNIENKEPTTPVERVLFNTTLPQNPRVNDSEYEQRKNTNSAMKKVKNKLSQWVSPLRTGYTKSNGPASDNESVSSTVSDMTRYEIVPIQ